MMSSKPFGLSLSKPSLLVSLALPEKGKASTGSALVASDLSQASQRKRECFDFARWLIPTHDEPHFTVGPVVKVEA